MNPACIFGNKKQKARTKKKSRKTDIKERTPTKINGSSVEDGAQKGESSPKGMVAQSEDSVNTKKQNGRAAISNEEYWEMNELNEERDAIRQEIHEKESRSLSRPA